MNGAECPVVREARAEDREVAVRTLVRAFDRDPVASFLLRADARRARAFEDVFDVAFRLVAPPFGERWITGDGRGVALWMGRSPGVPWGALLDGPKLARAAGWARLPKVLAAIARVESRHPRDPHAYLFAIGVDPTAQGRGLGGAMMRAALGERDARGEAAYLEASTEENARLYARFGFRARGEIRLADDGPVVRPMWRDPVAVPG